MLNAIFLVRVLIVTSLLVQSIKGSSDIHFIEKNVKKLKTALSNVNRDLENCFKVHQNCKSLDWIKQESFKSTTDREADQIIDTYLEKENLESFKKIDKVMNSFR